MRISDWSSDVCSSDLRRARGGVSVAPRVAGRIACVRVAPVVAPERYLMMSPVERAALAPRIGALSRRSELLIIRSIFPEMTADSVTLLFELDHDPGARTAARRVGTERVSTCRSRWSPYH